ncbi:MAG: hypothetical protein AAGI08_16435, partial [Bacteroidota bacterium]
MLYRALLLVSLLCTSAAHAQESPNGIPVEARVHPGAELVSIGLWLSSSYATPMDSQYKSDVWAHFGPHADHPGLDSLRTARMYPDFTEVGLLLDGFPDA